MNARSCCCLIVLAGVLFGGPGVIGAQPPVILPTPTGDVTVTADRLEQVAPDQYVATGNVEITRGSARLVADRIELDRATGAAIAQGRVIFYDGEDRLTGQRIDYNIHSGTGVVYQGEARAAPYYRIAGERMERIGESVYRVHRGVFTTCQDDPPTWSFRAGSATADLESFVYGTNASFWVRNVPLIPWFPFFAAAIRRERQTGFLFPKFGSSSRKGLFTEIPFFWEISDSQDATVALDYFTKRGVGGSAEYRYILSQDHRGQLSGFFIHENERTDQVPGDREAPGTNRGTGAFKHEWAIAPGLSLRADLNGVSDDFVLREYGDPLGQRAAQRVESNLFLTKSWSNWNLVGNIFWYQDLTTARPVELQRVPDIRLQGVRQPVPGLPGFLYETESSFVNFVRDVGADGMRFDLHPRLSRPVSAAGFFTVTPFLGARVTAYDKTAADTRLTRDGNFAVEETIDEGRVRRFAEMGTDLESRLGRIYDVGGRAGYQSLLHAIEPRVNYTWITGDNHGRLPVWDEIDRIPESSRLTYSITNRLRGKTVAPAGTEPVRLELVRFLVQNSYDFKNERFENVIGDLILQPSDKFRFRADAAYSVSESVRRGITEGVQTVNSDVSLFLERLSASLGQRFSEQPTSRFHFFQGTVAAELTRTVGVRTVTNYDIRANTLVENRVAVDLRYDCWAFSVEYVARHRDEDEFRFTLNLLGVGNPIKTSVGAGAFGPDDRAR